MLIDINRNKNPSIESLVKIDKNICSCSSRFSSWAILFHTFVSSVSCFVEKKENENERKKEWQYSEKQNNKCKCWLTVEIEQKGDFL
jgi:hypothetical protein